MAASDVRESMTTTWSVVGGGPAGLAAAIRLKQLAAERGRENQASSCWRKDPKSARTFCRAPLSIRSR